MVCIVLKILERSDLMTLWPNLLLLQGNALLLGNFDLPFLPKNPRIAGCVHQRQGCR